jgi:hypothetical protein
LGIHTYALFYARVTLKTSVLNGLRHRQTRLEASSWDGASGCGVERSGAASWKVAVFTKASDERSETYHRRRGVNFDGLLGFGAGVTGRITFTLTPL